MLYMGNVAIKRSWKKPMNIHVNVLLVTSTFWNSGTELFVFRRFYANLLRDVADIEIRRRPENLLNKEFIKMKCVRKLLSVANYKNK